MPITTNKKACTKRFFAGSDKQPAFILTKPDSMTNGPDTRRKRLE